MDLNAQNYAQMDTPLLRKMLAILSRRATNPQTDWDKQNARQHVDTIRNEINTRSRVPQS